MLVLLLLLVFGHYWLSFDFCYSSFSCCFVASAPPAPVDVLVVAAVAVAAAAAVAVFVSAAVTVAVAGAVVAL